LIPILYLKGISTGDFDEALVALLGKDAGGLSASTIGRLKDCQCRFKFPQMCRSKIPQSGGISVISRLTGDRWLHVWVDDRGGAAAVPGLAS